MHYEILETRKKEKEMLQGDPEVGVRSISNRLNALSINSYNHKSLNPYWDKFSQNDSEFIEIEKKIQKKRLDEEDTDEIGVMAQDEGKYMWLSSSALANTSDFYDSIDCFQTELPSIQNCMDGKETVEFLDEYRGKNILRKDLFVCLLSFIFTFKCLIKVKR